MEHTRREAAILIHLLALTAVGVTGCARSDSTGPPPPPTPPATQTQCGAGGVVQLQALQSATIDCSHGNVLDLTGGGASYLVVPQFAAGDLPQATVSYQIGVPAATAASAAFRRIASPRLHAASLQRAFDGVLLSRSRAAAGAWRRSPLRPAWERGGGGRGAAASPGVPLQVGDFRSFHVLATLDTVNVVYKTSVARLLYLGTSVALYVDTLAPANGATTADYTTIAQFFDHVLYPLDIGAFGEPTDLDGNGHVIMLLSPIVNAITSASQCASGGYIGGFFEGQDLAPSDSNSNQGEVFYGIVADPNGSVSCAHSTSTLLNDIPSIFLHELQHMISFGQHVMVNAGDSEEGWLDEGMSLIAEELGSRYYEARYPPPSGRTDPQQVFPDSSQAFIVDKLVNSYSYLLDPESETLTLHSDDQDGFEWRGGDWLLLRWLGDQKGSGFYRALVQSPATGIANIERVTGEKFPALFGDFSLSLVTDSLPGVARGLVPPRDQFISRNLRILYQSVYRVLGPSSSVPYLYPVQIYPLPSSGLVGSSMLPGTMAFYEVVAPSASTTVRIQFAPGSGGSATFAATLHPQLSIFRLPN